MKLRAGKQTIVAAILATLLLAAVCAAAVVSHVAIDVVGDFVLPHDAYDGVEHSSRLGLIVAAAGLLLTGALGMLWSACDAAREPRSGSTLRIVRSAPWFLVAVIALTVAAVAGMESLDVFLSGARVESISDAFGGSVFLGLALTLPAALLAGLLALRLGRFIERTRTQLARAIEALIAEIGRSAALAGPSVAPEHPPFIHPLAIRFARAAKRGPPCAA